MSYLTGLVRALAVFLHVVTLTGGPFPVLPGAPLTRPAAVLAVG